MFGVNDEDILRYFILVVALLLDPAAVLLLLAATRISSPLNRPSPLTSAVARPRPNPHSKRAGTA
jgi:hypothetical protein